MQRETLSVGHRYVTSIMNALVLGIKDPAEIEKLLNAGMDRVPNITLKDRVRLLELAPKTATQLGVVAHVPDTPEVVEPPVGAQHSGCADAILDDFLSTSLEDDVGLEASIEFNPVKDVIVEYLNSITVSLTSTPYKERFYVNKRVVNEVPYLFVASGSLRGPEGEYNIYGTAGNASNFASLDDKYFHCVGDKRTSAQLELDNIGPFEHIVLWGWAMPIVDGREIRLWINKRGGKDRAKAKLRMSTEAKSGYIVLKRS